MSTNMHRAYSCIESVSSAAAVRGSHQSMQDISPSADTLTHRVGWVSSSGVLGFVVLECHESVSCLFPCS